eukprot:scaffold142836_cov32-Tisochrysis_lutea.AAC.2
MGYHCRPIVRTVARWAYPLLRDGSQDTVLDLVARKTRTAPVARNEGEGDGESSARADPARRGRCLVWLCAELSQKCCSAHLALHLEDTVAVGDIAHDDDASVSILRDRGGDIAHAASAVGLVDRHHDAGEALVPPGAGNQPFHRDDVGPQRDLWLLSPSEHPLEAVDGSVSAAMNPADGLLSWKQMRARWRG